MPEGVNVISPERKDMEADLAKLQAHNDELEAEKRLLVKTVSKYASRSSYERELKNEFEVDPGSSWIEQDYGAAAREALKTLGLR